MSAGLDPMRRFVVAVASPKQRRALARFLSLISAEGIGRPEQILEHLENDQRRKLYYCLVDWLNAQTEQFSDLLQELATSDRLRRWLYDALNVAKMTAEFDRIKAKSRVRELYLAELFEGIDRVPVGVGAINEQTGLPNKVDMLYVCAIAKHLGAKQIFEIGTYMGRTTFHLAHTGPDTVVYTLNLPAEQAGRYGAYVGSYLRTQGTPGNVSELFSDSRDFDTGPYREQMDLVFIDGDHSYAMVENDTDKALDMLKPGGTVIWHDYAAKTPEVCRFIEVFSQSHPVFHVRNTALAVYRDGVDATAFTPHPMLDSLENRVNGGSPP